ncbi:hypothetical protein Taro_002681 [Colocasia esculenta]|uniref:Uncharacterized protein n=1 Tax=Colocasia esculenta TaxID=4460 RepID=A0A843TPG2_COLES|nr:hypothetical protein [Colocasia esculenta]
MDDGMVEGPAGGWLLSCKSLAGSCALVKRAVGVAIVRTKKQIRAMQAWRLASYEGLESMEFRYHEASVRVVLLCSETGEVDTKLQFVLEFFFASAVRAGSCALVKRAAGVAIVQTRKQIRAMQAWQLAVSEARRFGGSELC